MSRSLSFNEFDILTTLENCGHVLSFRELAHRPDMPAAVFDRTMEGLSAKGFVDKNALTPAGLDALKPYRVKRAVLVAAGLGSRLAPVTLSTPKPLVHIHGRRIIDSLLDAVLAAGIEEIYVIRGYLAEQFDQLLDKYPMIKFIENPQYAQGNNILSIIAAGDKIANAYIFDSDIILRNPSLVTKYQYYTNYLGVPVDATDDWCLESHGGIATAMSLGGTHCHHMYGVSYWTEADGLNLARDAKKTLAMPGKKDSYWDEVALSYFKEHYEIHIRECTFNDILEIDTYDELRKIDFQYAV